MLSERLDLMEMVTAMEMEMETTPLNHSGYHLPPNEGLHWPSRHYWDHHDKLPDLDLMILVYHPYHLLRKEQPILPSHTLTTHLHRSRDIPPNLAPRPRQRRRLRLRPRVGQREEEGKGIEYIRKEQKVVL